MRLLAFGTTRTGVLTICKDKCIEFLRKHYLALILVLIAILFFHKILVPGYTLDNVHYWNDLTLNNYNTKESLSYGQFPLWDPYQYSGNTYIGIPDSYFFDLNFLFYLATRNIFFSINLALVAYFIIGCLSMYSLIFYLRKDTNSAFIASLVYSFGGYFNVFVLNGHINILAGYSMMPMIFLFAYKAVKEPAYIRNAIIAGILLGLQVIIGSMIFFLYSSLLVFFVLGFSLFKRDFRKALTKALITGVIIGSVAIGFSAAKLLPDLDYSGMSNRSSGVSKSEFLGVPIKLSDFYNVFVSGIGFDGFTASLGITASIILLFGLLNPKKRIVLFSLLLAAFSILAASGGFVADLLYKVPGLGQMRHTERMLVYFAFSASILVAMGFSELSRMLRRLFKHKHTERVFFVIASALIITELIFLQRMPSSVEVVKPSDIPIVDYLSKDRDMARNYNLVNTDMVCPCGYNYFSQVGISIVKGGSGMWLNDYIEFYAVGERYNLSKFLGILNAKYVISNKNAQIPGMEMVREFPKCKSFIMSEVCGPFLYENIDFLPRAYAVNNSVLVVGNKEASKNFIYGLMLSKYFNPRNAVLVWDEKLKPDLDYMNRFSSIILLDAKIEPGAYTVLKQYSGSGGIVLPNVIEGKNSFSEMDIASMFSGFRGMFSEVDIRFYSPNRVTVGVGGKKGFLVLSERYAYFPGWTALDKNGKKVQLFKADNAITAVRIKGDEGEITFKYFPDSFRNGLIISIMTIMAVIIYFIIRILHKKKHKKGPDKVA